MAGRWEIAEAARGLAAKVVSGDLSLDQINANNLDEYFTAEAATPPDLCIRTAGEKRISNFMLWQMAYAELYFTDCYWPDFDENAFQQAIEDYHSRQRRFGSREPENNN
jgi:undecaprenyl diphosphate synthase